MIGFWAMGKWDRCASCKRDGVQVIWAVSPGPTACDWVTLWLTLVISRQMEMQMPESHLCAACMHCINSKVTYLCEVYLTQNYQKAKLQVAFACAMQVKCAYTHSDLTWTWCAQCVIIPWKAKALRRSTCVQVPACVWAHMCKFSRMCTAGGWCNKGKVCSG